MAIGSVSFHTAPSGLRMVHMAVPRSRVGYCGVMVRVGSRDEAPHLHGLAHFVEHTIFKGTARRRSWHIINRMESVGGELNAFTTKEETAVFSAFPNGNLARAAELIADLITSSRFPAAELDKERQVVADEIDSYLDTPSEAIFDDFEELIFDGSSMSHNILGSRPSLEGCTSETCQAYLRQWYVPSNLVAFYAGSQGPDRVFALLERAFEHLDGPAPAAIRPAPAAVATFACHKPIDTHQCHTIVGARIPSMLSAERHAFALFTNILGGPGMNSLLNVALRENRGLVYSVDASTALYSDCGVLNIYYGCDPDDNPRCIRLVRQTIDRVANGLISPRRLQAAKKQFLGQLVIAGENVENRIMSIARQHLFGCKILSYDNLKDAIDSIDHQQIARIAANLDLSSLSLAP